MFKCDLCPYETHRRDYSVKHRNKYHKTHKAPRKEFKCDICPYVTDRMNSLIRHKKVHNKIFTCDKCPYTAEECAIFITHKKTPHRSARRKVHKDRSVVEEGNKFKCSLCPYETSTTRSGPKIPAADQLEGGGFFGRLNVT